MFGSSGVRLLRPLGVRQGLIQIHAFLRVKIGQIIEGRDIVRPKLNHDLIFLAGFLGATRTIVEQRQVESRRRIGWSKLTRGLKGGQRAGDVSAAGLGFAQLQVKAG